MGTTCFAIQIIYMKEGKRDKSRRRKSNYIYTYDLTIYSYCIHQNIYRERREREV